MRKLLNIPRWAAAAALILLPCIALALTGGIITPYSYTGLAGGAGYGWIEVRYNAVADESHVTQWRLITDQGPEPTWRNVLTSGQTGPVKKRAQTYGIEFKRTTTSPSDTAPPPSTVPILENQKVTVKIRYL